MFVSREGRHGPEDAIPFTLVPFAGRSARSDASSLVGALVFVAVALALFAVLEGTPFQILPLALTIGGLIWLRLKASSLERDLRRARVRALDAIDLERARIQRDLHDSAQQRLVERPHPHGPARPGRGDGPAERDSIEQLGQRCWTRRWRISAT